MQVGKCHPLGSFEQMEAIHIARWVLTWFSKFVAFKVLLIITPVQLNSNLSFCPALLLSFTMLSWSTPPLHPSLSLASMSRWELERKIDQQMRKNLSAALTCSVNCLFQDLDEMNIEIIRNTLYKVDQPDNLLTYSKCVWQSTLWSTSTDDWNWKWPFPVLPRVLLQLLSEHRRRDGGRDVRDSRLWGGQKVVLWTMRTFCM